MWLQICLLCVGTFVVLGSLGYLGGGTSARQIPLLVLGCLFVALAALMVVGRTWDGLVRIPDWVSVSQAGVHLWWSPGLFGGMSGRHEWYEIASISSVMPEEWSVRGVGKGRHFEYLPARIGLSTPNNPSHWRGWSGIGHVILVTDPNAASISAALTRFRARAPKPADRKSEPPRWFGYPMAVPVIPPPGPW